MTIKGLHILSMLFVYLLYLYVFCIICSLWLSLLFVPFVFVFDSLPISASVCCCLL
jgi:hypothetical protein